MSRIKDAFYDEAEKIADVRNITLEEAMELLVEGEVTYEKDTVVLY